MNRPGVSAHHALRACHVALDQVKQNKKTPMGLMMAITNCHKRIFITMKHLCETVQYNLRKCLNPTDMNRCTIIILPCLVFHTVGLHVWNLYWRLSYIYSVWDKDWVMSAVELPSWSGFFSFFPLQISRGSDIIVR